MIEVTIGFDKKEKLEIYTCDNHDLNNGFLHLTNVTWGKDHADELFISASFIKLFSLRSITSNAKNTN